MIQQFWRQIWKMSLKLESRQGNPPYIVLVKVAWVFFPNCTQGPENWSVAMWARFSVTANINLRIDLRTIFGVNGIDCFLKVIYDTLENDASDEGSIRASRNIGVHITLEDVTGLLCHDCSWDCPLNWVLQYRKCHMPAIAVPEKTWSPVWFQPLLIK